MTKNELIALANEMRERVENLRDEMTHAVDEISKAEGDEASDLFYQLPNEGLECYPLFNQLMYALGNFAHRLQEKTDLPENTLVMCKAHESHLEGWRVQYYTGAGVTKPTKDTRARSGDWLYVVPLEYFHPDAPDWRPDECHNWANFGKEEK